MITFKALSTTSAYTIVLCRPLRFPLFTLWNRNPFLINPPGWWMRTSPPLPRGARPVTSSRNDGSLWGMGRNDRGQLGNAQGLDQGLVGWWKFDGDATDSSGNGNDGTVNGATLTTDRHGQASKAYSFDGVDDYILVPHHSSIDFNKNDPHTISVWVYAFNSSHSGSVMEKWVSAPAAPYPYVIRFSNDTIVYGRYDGVSSPSLSFSSALLSTEFVHRNF